MLVTLEELGARSLEEDVVVNSLPFWLERAILAENNGEPERALDIVYDALDDFLLDGSCDRVDEILKEINPAWLSTRLLLGFLTVTKLARERLESRASFLKKSREVIEKRGEMEPGLFDNL